MPDAIVDRGRGPEIAGTRITIYTVMDHLRDGSTPEEVAAALEVVTPDQVRAGIAYIAEHREEVDRQYARILGRVNQPNPAWVVDSSATTADELRRRIARRGAGKGGHDRPVGQ